MSLLLTGIIVIIYLSQPLLISLMMKVIENKVVVSCWAYSLISLLFTLFLGPIVKRHLTRFKSSKKQYLIFILIGTICFSFLLYIASLFMQNFMLLVNSYQPLDNTYALLTLLIVSICLPYILICIYKAVTDRIKINYTELPVIILSALLFTLMTLIYFYTNSLYRLPIYLLINLFFGLVIAYLYNQSTTLVIPYISLVIATIIVNIIVLYF